MGELITLEDVEAMPAGAAIRLQTGDIVTPSARDAADARGIQILDGEEGPAPASRPAPAPGPAVSETPGGGEQVIVSAIGRNRPRILAEITGKIAELNGNVLDINQRILQDYFTTIMIVEISAIDGDFAAFKKALEGISRPEDYRVSVQHEKVFHYMHRV